MSGNEMLSTVNTAAMADKLSDQHSPYIPQAPVRVAPFVREPFEVAATTSNLGPNARNVRFEMPKAANFLHKVYLRTLWAAMTLAGAASYLRYKDYLGYFFLRELRVINGQNRIQTIRPNDLFLQHENYFNRADRLSLDEMVKGRLSPAQRTNLVAKAFETKTPLHHLFCHDDVSKSLGVHGVAQKLTFEIDFAPKEELYQADSTFTAPFSTDAAHWSDIKMVGE